MELNFIPFNKIRSISQNTNNDFVPQNLIISNVNFSVFSNPLNSDFQFENQIKSFSSINMDFNNFDRVIKPIVDKKRIKNRKSSFSNVHKNVKLHLFEIFSPDSFSLFPPKKKFKCSYCVKSYKRKDYLTKHIFFEHSGYKGTKCKFCKKKYKRIKDHLIVCKKNPKNLYHKFIESKNYFKNSNNIRKKNNKNSRDKIACSFNETKNYSISLHKINDNNIILLKDYVYYLDYIIGNGGTMQTFYARNKYTGDDAAVKVELKKKDKSPILNEINILTKLKGIEQIPLVYEYKNIKGLNALCETLFGPNLKKIFEFTQMEFDYITISYIGIQMINVLRKIHERHIIHNDIKPENICWGKFVKGQFQKQNLFYLIDFGYSRDIFDDSKKFCSPKNEKDFLKFHYEDCFENKFQGTPNYMSINVGKGFRPSRKTDLEELIYSLIFLIKGNLPWHKIKGKTHKDTCIKINDYKSKIDIEELFKDIPSEIRFIYKNILKLDFKEKPEYDLYVILFENIIRRMTNGNIDLIEFSFEKEINELMKSKNKYINKINGNNNLRYIFNGYPLN